MSEAITTSTGVVFKTMDVPLMAIEAIKKKVNKERPRPPKNWIESKDREEINYNDPDYKAEMEAWDTRMILELYDGLIILGTEIESVPEGFPRPEDKWETKYEALGLEIAKDGTGRYLDWVKFCAAPGAEDIKDLMKACGRSAGVREEDVKDASELFRDKQKRGAN